MKAKIFNRILALAGVVGIIISIILGIETSVLIPILFWASIMAFFIGLGCMAGEDEKIRPEIHSWKSTADKL